MALALLFFHEHLSGREVLSAGLIVAGGAALGARGDLSGSLTGSLAIAAASMCWAIDNNLNAKLSLKDPVQLLRIKAGTAGAANLLLGLILGQRFTAPTAGWALLLGSISYGASFVCYLRAQRLVGAARQAALFGAAPFAGALLSVPLLGDVPSAYDLLGAGLMAAGVLLLIRARHGHVHTHDSLEHEHAHVHDEHHQHAHEGPVEEPHSHWHRHDALTHDHPHVSDAHHKHTH
jgi:drug/metabolite transporter (DMT)-like permease